MRAGETARQRVEEKTCERKWQEREGEGERGRESGSERGGRKRERKCVGEKGRGINREEKVGGGVKREGERGRGERRGGGGREGKGCPLSQRAVLCSMGVLVNVILTLPLASRLLPPSRTYI